MTFGSVADLLTQGRRFLQKSSFLFSGRLQPILRKSRCARLRRPGPAGAACIPAPVSGAPLTVPDRPPRGNSGNNVKTAWKQYEKNITCTPQKNGIFLVRILNKWRETGNNS